MEHEAQEEAAADAAAPAEATEAMHMEHDAQAAPAELADTQPYYYDDMHSPRRSPPPRRIRSSQRSISLPQLLPRQSPPQPSPSPKQRRRKRRDFSSSPSSTEKQLQQSSVNQNSAFRMEDNENTGVAAAPGFLQSMTTFFSSLFGSSKKQKK